MALEYPGTVWRGLDPIQTVDDVPHNLIASAFVFATGYLKPPSFEDLDRNIWIAGQAQSKLDLMGELTFCVLYLTSRYLNSIPLIILILI